MTLRNPPNDGLTVIGGIFAGLLAVGGPVDQRQLFLSLLEVMGIAPDPGSF